MLRGYRTVRAIATIIANAGDQAISAYRDERVTDEPHITDRLMGAIEDAINSSGIARGYRLPDLEDAHMTSLPDEEAAGDDSEDALAASKGKKLTWRAMTLRSGSGSAAHEKRFGADILGVLSIDTPGYRVSKGFLAQAKRAEPREPFSKSEWKRLQQQCDVMLATTPDAFVMVYSKQYGVRMMSASAVTSYSGRDIFSLYHQGLRLFFERHIESFIGDRRLNRPHISVLEAIKAAVPPDEQPSSHVLHLNASLSE